MFCTFFILAPGKNPVLAILHFWFNFYAAMGVPKSIWFKKNHYAFEIYND